MEFAVYRIFRRNGRELGEYVNMFASREEAEELAERLGGEHRVVKLRTREIGEDDDYSTVLFSDESDVVVGDRKRGGKETNEQQTEKAGEGVAGYVESLSLEEVERELRALREYDAQLTLDESILAGVYTAELEAARKRKLRERQVAEAADPQTGEREEE